MITLSKQMRITVLIFPQVIRADFCFANILRIYPQFLWGGIKIYSQHIYW